MNNILSHSNFVIPVKIGIHAHFMPAQAGIQASLSSPQTLHRLETNFLDTTHQENLHSAKPHQDFLDSGMTNSRSFRTALNRHLHDNAIRLLSFFLFCIFLQSCTFTANFAKNPQQIGSIAPSSSHLAKIITQYIPDKGAPKNILEVGAGTGSFTRKIIQKMNEGDRLDVIELEPELCQKLNDDFKNLPNVFLHCQDILKFVPNVQYDYIVSGLPFNSFDAQLVQNITTRYTELTKPNAIVSFFEYMWLPTIRKWFLKQEQKEKLEKTRSALMNFVNSYEFDRAHVYLNITPARVYFLRIAKP